MVLNLLYAKFSISIPSAIMQASTDSCSPWMMELSIKSGHPEGCFTKQRAIDQENLR